MSKRIIATDKKTMMSVSAVPAIKSVSNSSNTPIDPATSLLHLEQAIGLHSPFPEISLIDIEQNAIILNDEIQQSELEKYKLKVYDVIKELVEELDVHRREDHKQLAIKTLLFLEVPDVDIKGWFNGNIIL